MCTIIKRDFMQDFFMYASRISAGSFKPTKYR